jgi:hypothetical protein
MSRLNGGNSVEDHAPCGAVRKGLERLQTWLDCALTPNDSGRLRATGVRTALELELAEQAKRDLAVRDQRVNVQANWLPSPQYAKLNLNAESVRAAS